MITRNDIAKELKKHKDKDKETKKSEIEKYLKKEGVDKKKHWKNGHYVEEDEVKMILDDLNSYADY